MKNRLFTLTALLFAAVIALPCASFAGKKGGGGEIKGKIEQVDTTAKTITISLKSKGKKGGDSGASSDTKTFTVTDSTKITLDGKDAKLADLASKMEAKVTPGTSDNTAASIEATTKSKKKG